MTQDNSSDETQSTESGSDWFNTAAGWVLFAGILGLGGSIVSGKVFHGDSPERPEQLGYVIEVAEEEGDEAEMTMAEALNMEGVDVSAGERVFAKCQACHTIEQGGANGIGPNLYGVMGQPIGQHVPAFGYSAALASKGGNWGWDEMNEWLANPRGYVDGTSMGFAGLSSIEDRAALALYLNAQGSNLPVPSYVVDVAEEAEAEAEGEAEVAQDVAEETSEETAAAEATG
ncbi:MAG: c-type cytochrome [Erythrobacter sp.]